MHDSLDRFDILWIRCGRLHRLVALAAPVALLALGAPGRSGASDLTSTSYRLRALHPSAFGPARLVRPGVPTTTAGSAASVGQGDALGPFGSPTTLTTLLPGIWPIAARSLPALDVDHDQHPWFLDADDDGDGLLDVVETGTGLFVSASNTGTSSVDADSDDDGHPDGAEVAAGTDPNDPLSPPPPPPAVPLTSPPGLVLFALVALESLRRFVGERRRHV